MRPPLALCLLLAVGPLHAAESKGPGSSPSGKPAPAKASKPERKPKSRTLQEMIDLALREGKYINNT